MKKIIFILIIFSSSIIIAQDTSIANYFPTIVGNVWVFNCNAGGSFCMCIKRYRTKIISSVVNNGKTYYVFQTTNFIISCGNGACTDFFGTYDTLRIDAASGNILKYLANGGCSYSPHEILFDSLRSRKNDTVKQCIASPFVCVDTIVTSVLGSNRQTKAFGVMFVDSYWSRRYAKGIGPAGTSNGGQICTANMTLVGCVVGGVLLGDTSFIVGANQVGTEIPETFSLSQNYPNPFNPTTNIKFSVPQKSFVTITIYNVLGEEISKLVSEEFSPGTYETNWDGTNYPSGVYYYKITAGDFAETKKMILIK